jgi:hypothetical protein
MVIAIDLALAKGGGMLHLLKSQRESSASTASRAGFPTFSASPSNWLAGCGRGRYRDAATHMPKSRDFGRLNGAAGSAGQK